MVQGEEGEREHCGANSGQGFCSSLQGFPGLECLPASHRLHWAPPATNQIIKWCLLKDKSYLQLDLSQVPALCLLHPCQVPLVLSGGLPPRVGQGEVEQRHFCLAVLRLRVLVRLRGLLCFWGHLKQSPSLNQSGQRFSQSEKKKSQS